VQHEILFTRDEWIGISIIQMEKQRYLHHRTDQIAILSQIFAVPSRYRMLLIFVLASTNFIEA